MIKLYKDGAFLLNGVEIAESGTFDKNEAKKQTIAHSILQSHNQNSQNNSNDNLKIKFDALASHDITYVGIIQTARASGLTEFPVPYVMTNCHNSLGAVGGTINEDDHVFGLSAAKKHGGIFVPAHMAVIHTYMREMMSGCGKMILGSDSHTRYGALGTLAIGEGGGELAKQLLGKTYDIKTPEIIGVYLKGMPIDRVGPMDVALAIIKAVFDSGFVKNKVMEFVGSGIANLSVEFRNGIDVMTTEMSCLSSVWQTDEKVFDYFKVHGRQDAFKTLTPGQTAYYDGMIEVDLSKIRPMIAMPFHPANVYEIDELNRNLTEILHDIEQKAVQQLNAPNIKYTLTDKIINNRLSFGQGSIVGCSGGTFENIACAADILDGKSVGTGAFSLSVYPGSQPVYSSLVETGVISRLMQSGAIIRSAFCGPCFGACDAPANNTLSLRHATRNFPSREGSKPGAGQIASVALADAKTIAATASNKGILTAATEIDITFTRPVYSFKKEIYNSRVYNGYKKPDNTEPLIFGPNIVDWPEFSPLTDNIILKVASFITDPVTTTDELIPSGETSSYRSNPLGLAEFTLSRKDPQYVPTAKAVKRADDARKNGERLEAILPELINVYKKIKERFDIDITKTAIGTTIYAKKPGDGSAREQAASCQRVLGGMANICEEYATKRYRSNLINWGMLPFTVKGEPKFKNGDYIFIPDIRKFIENGDSSTAAYIVSDILVPFEINISELTDDEKRIVLDGCLINYYK